MRQTNSDQLSRFPRLDLHPGLLSTIKKKGYSTPTPIQRQVIPVVLSGSDVIAMARTGSGKTLAFTIPVIQRLQSHSAAAGIRALVLAPTRELCLQTYKYMMNLTKGSDLRVALVTGGDSLESHFEVLAANPDIVIAAPGRLVHLLAETDLSLAKLEMLVFDEADRLLEMGFQTEIDAIIRQTPVSRQTLLFSATMPQAVAEFSKAGLKDPEMIRLDTDAQLSDQLFVAHITARPDEKTAALLSILQSCLKKDQQAIVFTCSRHHVDYLADLLAVAGWSVTTIFGNMDASARRINLAKFTKKKAQVMIVTDVASRGIDIPQLELVINYDFPDKPKLFVHRVGRTARNGRSGSAISILLPEELPYLLDLELFLSSSKVTATLNGQKNCVHGRLPFSFLQSQVEAIQSYHKTDVMLAKAKQSMENALKLYKRTRVVPSRASVLRARSMQDENGVLKLLTHPLFLHLEEKGENTLDEFVRTKLQAFRPTQNIFEVQSNIRTGSDSALMAKRRHAYDQFIEKTRAQKIKDRAEMNGEVEDDSKMDVDEESTDVSDDDDMPLNDEFDVEELNDKKRSRDEVYGGDTDDDENSEDEKEEASDSKMAVSSSSKPVVTPKQHMRNGKPVTKKLKVQDWRDDKYFMTGRSSHAGSIDGLAIKEKTKTIEDMVMDMNPDDDRSIFKKRSAQVWDKKKGNFVNEADASGVKKGKLKLRNESGQLVIVGGKDRGKAYRDWSEKTHKHIPKVGEASEEAMPVKSLYRHKLNQGPSAAEAFHASQKGKHGGKRDAPVHAIKTKDQILKKRHQDAKAKALKEKFAASKKKGGQGKRHH